MRFLLGVALAVLTFACSPPAAADDDLGALIAQLESSDNAARLKAAAKVAALGEAGLEAAPALLEAVKCEQIEVLFPSPQIAASRRRFADALVRLGPKVAARLESALKHPNGLVRVWAAYALWKLDAKRVKTAAPVLIESLRGGSEVAEDAALVLEEIGVGVRQAGPAAAGREAALIENLKRADFRVRCSAAFALASAGGSDAVREALTHDHPLVRVGAAFAVQKADEDALTVALETLTSALRDRSKEVRKQAVWAAGQMGARARPLAATLIGQLADLEPDPLPHFFGGFLGRFGADPSLVIVAMCKEPPAALLAALESESPRARVMAATALLGLDPASRAKAAPILRAGMQSGDPVAAPLAGMIVSRKLAAPEETDIDALVKSLAAGGVGFGPSPAAASLARRGKDAVPPLMQLLRGDDGRAARSASGVLSQIGAPALPALKEAMQSPDVRLRVYAATALSGMGELAVESLGEALRDDAYPVRRIARLGLQAIGSEKATAALERARRSATKREN